LLKSVKIDGYEAIFDGFWVIFARFLVKKVLK